LALVLPVKNRELYSGFFLSKEENFSITPVDDFNSTFLAKNTEDSFTSLCTEAKCNKMEGQIF
jgi:hypothetical protein